MSLSSLSPPAELIVSQASGILAAVAVPLAGMMVRTAYQVCRSRTPDTRPNQPNLSLLPACNRTVADLLELSGVCRPKTAEELEYELEEKERRTANLTELVSCCCLPLIYCIAPSAAFA